MKGNIFLIIFYVLLIVFAVWISKAIFDVVYYSDMPAWLKYIMLK